MTSPLQKFTDFMCKLSAHAHDIITLVLSRTRSKKSTFGDTPSYLGFDVSTLPQNPLLMLYKVDLKVKLGGKSEGESGSHFQGCLDSCSAKVKACHDPLQVSGVAVQVYPALHDQLMQASFANKISRMKI